MYVYLDLHIYVYIYIYICVGVRVSSGGEHSSLGRVSINLGAQS